MNKDMLAVLPKPKKISFKRSCFSQPSRQLSCWIPEGADLAVFFQENGVRFHRAASAAKATLVARIDHRALDDRVADAALLDEGYVLDVSKSGMVLSARTDRGLFYGLQTVRQLTQAGDPIRAMHIEDWPDMQFRGVHLMMGCLMPTFERMKHVVEIMARHKLNAFVIEYDHCFKWEKYPFLSHSEAYTKSQTMELEEYAAARFVEIIPCIDSLGHVNPYLCHEELAHLREKPDCTSDLCPSNPRAMAFIQDLWREVLDAHPRSRRAHITGDEAFLRGVACPACRRTVKKDGMGSLVAKYYTELSRWIRQQGRTAIMWDDMLIKHADRTQAIPNDIIMCDWMYDNVTVGPWRAEDRYWNGTEGRTPGAWEKHFSAYWAPGKDGGIEPFPYLRYFQDKGNPVIASTAACPGSQGASMLPYASQSDRQVNIMGFANAVKNRGALGLLNTFWPLKTPLDAAWNTLLMGADYSWHSRIEPPAAFGERFGRAFLNAKGTGRSLFTGLDYALDRVAPGETAMFDKAWPEKSLKPLVRVCDSLTKTIRDTHRAPFVRVLSWCVRFADIEAQLGTVFNRIDATRLGAGHDQPADISKHLTHDFFGATVEGALAVPFMPGTHRLSGVEFMVQDPASNDGKAVISLRGRRMQNAPTTINGIKINRHAHRVFILCSGFDAHDNVPIAEAVLRMADNSEHRFAIMGGQNILDWSGGIHRAMPRGIFATQRRLRKGCLCWLDNPEPEKQLATIDFTSTGDKGSLTIAGVTTRILSGRQPSINRGTALKLLMQCEKKIESLMTELTGTIYPEIMPETDAVSTCAKMAQGSWPAWIDIYRQILA